MSAKTKAQLLAEIEALKKRLAELQAVKAEPHQKNDIFKKQAHALGERVKELNCLFGISSLEETPGISLAEILQGSAELLPPAWQYPQITCARVTLDNQEYKTKNFRETKWKLASGIKVEGKRAGVVEVFYLEKQPKSDQDSFLKEERALINAVAERLGRIIHRVGAQERIEHLTLVLRTIRNVNQLIIREKNRGVLIHEICDTMIETRGYSTAWIMLLDERGKYLDSAESGLGKSFTHLLKELKRGDFPACVRQAQAQPSPAEIIDLSSTCADCPISDKYSDKGRMTIRLEHAEKVYGVLSVSFGVDIAVDEEELSLFEEVAGDIAFALYSIKTEQERDEAEAELLLKNLVFDVSISANSVADTQGILTNVNEAFLDIWGYSNKEEVIGKPISDFLSFADEANKIVSALNETGTWEGGYTALKKDKTTFDAYGLATVIKDKSGNIIGYQSAVQDISQKKQADQKLLTSEEQLRRRTQDLTLINNINTAVNQGKGLRKIFHILAEQTRQIFTGLGATVYLLSRNKKKLVMQESYLPQGIEKQVKKLIGMNIPRIELALEPESFYQQTLLGGKPRLIYEPAEIQAMINEFVSAAPLPVKVRAGIKKLIPQIQKILKSKSVAIIPLLEAGKAIGILDISSPGMFTESDIERLSTIAEQVTSAIVRVQTHTEIERLGYEELLLDSAGEGILGIAKDGVHTFVNRAVADMLGYSKEELIGKKSHGIWHHTKKDGTAFPVGECPNYQTMETGEPFFIEDDIFWKKDGTSFPVEYSSTPIYEHNHIVGSVVTFRDITARKQAEQKLRDSEEYQKVIFETTSLPTGIIEEDTTISMVNKEFEKISGFSKEELESKMSWTEFVGADDLKRMKEYHQQRRIDPDTVVKQYEFQFINREGVVRNILLNVDLIPGTKKSVASFLDITERVQTQQEIEMLLQLSRQAGTETNLENLLFFIADQIVEVIHPAETASIFFYNEERETLEVQAWAGFVDSEINGLEFSIEDSQVGRIFRTKKPALIKDVSESSDFKPIDKPSLIRVKSQMAVPLLFGKRIIGIMFADNLTRINAFSQKNLDLLESIGNQLAGVIENARLLDQVREKEEQYHSVVEDTPGLINRFLPDGTITFANQEYCRFFGKKYDELIGTNIQSTIPEEDREKVISNIASLTEESPIQISVNKNIKHNNEIRWMRWTDRALFDDKGKINSIQSFGEDITEQVLAQEKLKISEGRFRAFMENVPAFAYILNKDLQHIYGNPASIAADGYSSLDGYIGTSIQDRYPDEISGEINANSLRVLSEGCVSRHEFTISEPDGKFQTILDIKFPIQLPDGGIQVGGFAIDITERKQVEEELAKNEARYRELFDNSPIPIWEQDYSEVYKYFDELEKIGVKDFEQYLTKNPDELFKCAAMIKVKDVNVATVSLFKAKSRDDLKKSIGDVFVEESLPEFKKSLLSIASRKKAFQSEVVLQTLENEKIIALLKWSVIGDRVITTTQDITEQKRTEQLLNALNRAAVAMGTAQTHQDIFKAISDELKQIDISCMLFPLDETQERLITEYLSYESGLLSAVEKLVGKKQENFSFPIDVVDAYSEVVKKKRTFFSDNSGQNMMKILPKLAKKLTTYIIKLLHLRKSISAPLIVKNQVIGVFSIQSDILTREDIPAATAFADQLSSAWSKIGLLRNLRKTVEGTIYTIAATVEARDPYTAGHQKRVADLSAAIASKMHLSDDRVEGIKMAGVIHDLGKVQIPAEILSKPGKISELEYKIIQTHPRVGFDLLKEIDFPWPIAQMVFQHHEMMDGSGYPQGLMGDEIILEARILAVADMVEAMASHRPYRPAQGIEKALKQIRQDKGTLLDPSVVDACMKIFKGGYKLPVG